MIIQMQKKIFEPIAISRAAAASFKELTFLEASTKANPSTWVRSEEEECRM